MRKFFALLRIQLLARYADLKPSNLKNTTDQKEKGKKHHACLFAADCDVCRDDHPV